MGWIQTIKDSQFLQNIHNKIASLARQRSEENKTSVRSHIAGLEVGNLLISLSTTGLMTIGVIPMSLSVLVIMAVIFLILGIAGRYIDSVEDDVERLLKYEEHICSSAASGDTTTSSTDSLQQ